MAISGLQHSSKATPASILQLSIMPRNGLVRWQQLSSLSQLLHQHVESDGSQLAIFFEDHDTLWLTLDIQVVTLHGREHVSPLSYMSVCLSCQ